MTEIIVKKYRKVFYNINAAIYNIHFDLDDHPFEKALRLLQKQWQSGFYSNNPIVSNNILNEYITFEKDEWNNALTKISSEMSSNQNHLEDMLVPFERNFRSINKKLARRP